MNCVRRRDKPFRMVAAFVTVMVVLTLTGAVIPAQAQTYKDLHDFNPNNGDPNDLLYTGLSPQGWDGKLYGIAQFGGTSNAGTVYSITLNGTPAIIHSFDGTDGSNPYLGLTLGKDGKLYGTAVLGGGGGDGTVYKITPTGTLTVLHNFTNTGDGGWPLLPPVEGNDGSFYGATSGFNGTTQFTSTFSKSPPPARSPGCTPSPAPRATNAPTSLWVATATFMAAAPWLEPAMAARYSRFRLRVI